MALFETLSIPVFKAENMTPMTLHPPAEDARYLMARLQIPSTFAPETFSACGVEGTTAPGEALADALIVSRDRNLDTVLKLKIRRATPELAKNCITTIVKLLNREQDEIQSATIGSLDEKIAMTEKQIELERAGMATANPNELFIRRFEAIDLNNRLTMLMEMKSNTRSARLLSPVYASPNAVFPPSILVTMALGSMAGVCIAILFIIINSRIRQNSIDRFKDH